MAKQGLEENDDMGKFLLAYLDNIFNEKTTDNNDLLLDDSDEEPFASIFAPDQKKKRPFQDNDIEDIKKQKRIKTKGDSGDKAPAAGGGGGGGSGAVAATPVIRPAGALAGGGGAPAPAPVAQGVGAGARAAVPAGIHPLLHLFDQYLYGNNTTFLYALDQDEFTRIITTLLPAQQLDKLDEDDFFKILYHAVRNAISTKNSEAVKIILGIRAYPKTSFKWAFEKIIDSNLCHWNTSKHLYQILFCQENLNLLGILIESGAYISGKKIRIPTGPNCNILTLCQDLDIFRRLVELNKDTVSKNAYTTLNSAINLSILANHLPNPAPEIIKYILQVKDIHGEPLLDINVQNKQGRTALYSNCLFLSRNNNKIQILIDSGANPNIYDKDNISPLSRAIKRRDIRVIETLLPLSDLGPHFKDNNDQKAPLRTALEYAQYKADNTPVRNDTHTNIVAMIKAEITIRGGKTEVPAARLDEIEARRLAAINPLAAIAPPAGAPAGGGGSGAVAPAAASAVARPAGAPAGGGGSGAVAAPTRGLKPATVAPNITGNDDGETTDPYDSDSSSLDAAPAFAPAGAPAGGGGSGAVAAPTRGLKPATVAPDITGYDDGDATDPYDSDPSSLDAAPAFAPAGAGGGGGSGAAAGGASGKLSASLDKKIELRTILNVLTTKVDLPSLMLKEVPAEIVTDYEHTEGKILIKADGDCLFNAVLLLTMIQYPEKLKAAFPGVKLRNIDQVSLRELIVKKLATIESSSPVLAAILTSIEHDINMLHDEENDPLNKYSHDFAKKLKEIRHFKELGRIKDKDIITEIEKIGSLSIIKEYRTALSNPGFFGGDLELNILSEILDLKICIKQPNTRDNICIGDTESDEIITLYFNGEDHYDVLVSSDQHDAIRQKLNNQDAVDFEGEDDMPAAKPIKKRPFTRPEIPVAATGLQNSAELALASQGAVGDVSHLTRTNRASTDSATPKTDGHSRR
jgi:hypothetical protein